MILTSGANQAAIKCHQVSFCTIVNKIGHGTNPSSFCTRASGFADDEPMAGVGLLVAFSAFPPPPPRKGFAMRPKLNGDDAAAF